jgi:hypothetical protein
MPQDMTPAADRDALAAEYVLGTLDADERSAARALIAEDEEFAGKVRVWERRLGELHLMVDPVEPEPEIWLRIKAKVPPRSAAPITALSDSQSDALLQPAPEPGAAREIEPTSSSVIEQAPDSPLADAPGTPVLPDARLEPSSEPLTKGDTASAGKSDFEAGSEFEREIAEIGRGLKAATAAPEIGAIRAEAASPASDETTPQLSDEQADQAAELKELDATTPAAPAAAETVQGQGAEPDVPHPAVTAVPEQDQKLRRMRRSVARWRAAAGVLLLAMLAVAVFPALWKYAPDRVPPELRPLSLLRSIGIPVSTSSPGPRAPAPPESRFDE